MATGRAARPDRSHIVPIETWIFNSDRSDIYVLKDLSGLTPGNDKDWQFIIPHALRANGTIVLAGLIYNTLCPTGNRKTPENMQIPIIMSSLRDF